MNRKRRILPLALLLTLPLVDTGAQQGETRKSSLSVAVIAPSVSTSMEARRIIAHQKWSQAKFEKADAILVVVRSMLFNPLRANYTFIGELQQDADRQLNIAGENFHIYLYQLGDDLECTQLNHTSYKAE